ncbi:MAG TPA: TonB-dependent receptor [Croceibacterium sp.]
MAAKGILAAVVALAVLAPVAAAAQDESNVIVTGMRSNRSANEYYDEQQSAIGLTRKADYFVKPLYVSSDSRDPDERRQELFAMLRATIERAGAAGITLVAGDFTLTPVTVANMEELSIGSGNRPDTSRVQIYARMPVSSSVASVREADRRITAFVKSVPVTGRSFVETGGTVLGLSNPDQYRLEVVKTIADEARRYAAQFGSDYGIEIRGLDSELFWQQASETDVFLYIAHSFVVRPK